MVAFAQQNDAPWMIRASQRRVPFWGRSMDGRLLPLRGLDVGSVQGAGSGRVDLRVGGGR